MVTSSQPTVSVIIPARDAQSALPEAIASVKDQDYPNVIEVIVAAADDQSAAASNGASVVANPGGSTPAGLNIAIARSSGEVVVRCDAQSKLPRGYVTTAVSTMQRTEATVVGGRQVPVGSTTWEKAIAAAMRSRLGAGDARYRVGGQEGPVETVYLGVFDRTALERLGGYDERFVRTQDYELNHRVIESGGTVWFDPELAVEYRPRGSVRSLWQQYFEYGRAKRLFRKVHPGSLRLRQMAPPALVLTLVASIVASAWAPAFLLIPTGYAVSLLVAGLAQRSVRMGVALGAMHLAWGLGYLMGSGPQSP